MYVAMLLTDWCVSLLHPGITLTHACYRNVVNKSGEDDSVYIGRSEVAMWMRVVSSWVCMLLYIWSLVAPALFPDRCVFRGFSTGLRAHGQFRFTDLS